MAATHGYANSEVVKRSCGIVDDEDNDALDAAITAASRAIDNLCGRRFFLDASASARLYLLPQTIAPAVIYIDDFDPATAPTVQVDIDNDGTFESTWTVGTDYQLEPLIYSNIEPMPQNQVRLLVSQWLRYPTLGRPNLQVTAKWGWPAVPAAVQKATEIIAVDLWKSKDAAFGIGGNSEYGVYRVRDNPIAMSLLGPYRLPQGLA